MFSWFTGKVKSGLPETTAIQVQRTRQIEQLKAFNQNVSEIQRDVEYRVNTVIGGTTISLVISLPPRFPQEKPLVKVTPRVSHPWVNDQMIVVGSPGLNNFVVHSDLGKVIREIVEEFHRNPPTMLPAQMGYGTHPYGACPSVTSAGTPTSLIVQPAGFCFNPQSSQQQINIPSYITSIPVSVHPVSVVSGIPHAGMSSHSTTGDAHNVNNRVPGQLQSQLFGGSNIPELPESLKSQLKQLSDQKLQELLDDENKLLQMLGCLPEVEQLARDQEHCMEVNDQLARNNLSLKPVLEEKKKVLLEKYDIFNEVKADYDKNAERQEQLRQFYDIRHIQDNLKVAALQAEEESESIAERFLEGKITVEEFKKNYMSKRKLSHLRHAKEERLEQLRMVIH